ncbi:hydroxyethylthiazole kinase [Bacillus solimangrovi]|uniref:Hydroxyethylthiazole kinase n=1 Tax=Bacillus solimangrovi TaxID=1305675 RepID=A0A1E5LB44_9BACI|nr:hydroxyethylthiazole kinase [Bacillus solimangrovi]OEH91305.1 hydroxyethylthiazole kinase [Bacillus solimangrovi]
MNRKKIIQMVEQVRIHNPLIHNLTNVVVTNFTANGLLAIGASPVMSTAIEEVEDLASISNGVLINIGTVTSREIEAMLLAGKAANKKGIPVVLDPVGVGATPFRMKTVQKLLENVKFTAIRGNAAEIANIIGESWEIKGVDSQGDGDVRRLATAAANQLKTMVVVTGEVDIISNGKLTYEVHNGHVWMTKVTGSGCLLGAVVSAFLAANENKLEASVAALVYYGVAAELAVKQATGPGSFQTAFLDALSNVNEEEIQGLASYNELIIGESHV